MATKTKNYELIKPDIGDFYDIGVQNRNMDTVDTELKGLEDGKVAKAVGKGLSSNDYTTAEKAKLEGVAVGANNYVHPDSAAIRHVSDAEKVTWNGKQAGGNYVTKDSAGNVAISGELTLKGEKAATISKSINATLTVAGWTGSVAPYTQTVSVAGVTASNNISVSLASNADLAQVESVAGAMLMATSQGSGTITFTARGDKPSVNLSITVLIFS